ncbi:ribonuclease P protein component [Orrella daihaiensis]|uniref:Ribonuclease P protein component n=1 Tax=Orrella daihaiensis TaxID=2782176 RepID=A0ABY4AR62_9BURK|nr:ribonuclease P protein component [Orrella daihaiensis]
MASSSLSFSRKLRLLSPEQFAVALRSRPVGRSPLLTFHWCKSPTVEATDNCQPKLGLIIPKRLARLSVQRNAIKRVLRESFRHQQSKLPGGYYVARLAAPLPTVSLTELKRLIRQQADSILIKASLKK